jgi:hypothetical protein
MASWSVRISFLDCKYSHANFAHLGRERKDELTERQAHISAGSVLQLPANKKTIGSSAETLLGTQTQDGNYC